jgi:hypothetical protein
MRPFAIFILLALAALLWWGAKEAFAHAMLCGPRANIVASLTGKYQEAVIGRGIADDATVLEIYASKKGTWSIVISKPQASCVIATGKHFEQMTPRIKGEKI